MKYTEVVDKFLMYLASIDRSLETIEGYRKELEYFNRYLKSIYIKDLDVKDITLENIEGYMYHIKQRGKADSTRKRVVYILRSFYNYACKRKLCEENLPATLESIKTNQKERVFLDEEEIELMFIHISHPILKSAIQTLYYTGMRVSELTNLRLRDLDMENRLIYIIAGKGNKNRTIPINSKLYKILKDYLKDIRPVVDSDRLFCTQRSGKLSSQYINKTLYQAQKNSGIEKRVSAHVLRHSFASHLIKLNVPLPYVQKLLGHADLRVTSIYIHQDMGQLREAIDRM